MYTFIYYILLLNYHLKLFTYMFIFFLDTAKQFFEVIAEKGNTLYNVISDIISILSNPENLVPENDFQTIMK